MYYIEKDIDVPSISAGRINKYPFGSMEVGDSFTIGSKEDARKIQNACQAYGARKGMKFSVRKYLGGYRCWRVA